MDLLKLLAFFDVETTGLSAIYNDLIQVAASKMYKGNIIATLMNYQLGILVSFYN